MAIPVRQRILFKLAVLLHKCLNERAPDYLADDCRWTATAGPVLDSKTGPAVAGPAIVVRDDETGSLIDQNDVRRPILYRQRTICLEQSTGRRQFATQHYQLLSFLIDSVGGRHGRHLESITLY